MTPRPAALPMLLALLARGACSAGTGNFPSLAIRPAERITATARPVAPEPPPPPPPSAAVLDQIGQLRATAADADKRFAAAAQAARAPVAAARGAAPGSEQWSVAQVALSDAEARHNEAVAALSGLDRIYVTAQTDGSDPSEIETAVNAVTAQVQAQSETLATLEAGLGS